MIELVITMIPLQVTKPGNVVEDGCFVYEKIGLEMADMGGYREDPGDEDPGDE